jgi:hypothetical protein
VASPEKAQRTKQSCLQKLADGEAALSPLVTLREEAAAGLAPAFDESGFTRPAAITLIAPASTPAAWSARAPPRSSASRPTAPTMTKACSRWRWRPARCAKTPPPRSTRALWIGNLHYLNFSDRASGRITGLTRFATFWVENGEPVVAPVNVMRFDDSLYRMLGDNLEALTDAPEWMLNSLTYGQRSVQTSRVTGALLQRDETVRPQAPDLTAHRARMKLLGLEEP